MLSQTAEYALRIVAFLAGTGESPQTTAQIAAGTRVPIGYLAKVLQALSRAGLVRSQRGLHGGSVLARPAQEISIYDVVEAVDPINRIRTCPLGLRSHGSALCPLHRRLDNALAMVEGAFRATTIAELLAESSTSRALCESKTATQSSPVGLTVSARGRRRNSRG